MLADFEARLAEVLGSRLPAPFTGRVAVAPGAPAGSGPVVQVAVGAVTPLDPDFGSVRPEQPSGSADRRRVVRLRCEVAVEVVPEETVGRSQRVRGIDALLHLLDDGEFRDGSALVAAGDTGFVLDSLRIAGADLSPAPAESPAPATATPAVPAVRLSAEGWFWPVGVVGETGAPIVEALVRQAVLPILLRPAVSQLVAGSDPVALELGLGATGFTSLVVGLLSPSGGAGVGTLTGGSAGPEGRRVVDVDGGTATVTYEPPGSPATDQLVVSAVVADGGGEQRVGLELARFRLRVVSPA